MPLVANNLPNKMTYSKEFYENIVDNSLSSARVVVPLIVDLISPKSVIDVGCASGAWLSVFRDHGVQNILGIDGSHIESSAMLIPQSSFRAADLSNSFRLQERFDIVVSLEVAEHLPESSANRFVESLCHLAPFILFSAAVPGQRGVNHVNLQWPEYWRQLFAKYGFQMFDPFRALLWHDERVAPWYRQNLFLLIHHDILESRRDLLRLPPVTSENTLMLVAGDVLDANLGLRASLNRVPKLVWKKLSKTFRSMQLKSSHGK
jgi:SAM-dependent methyltransferase